jgi:hypothetical protein
MSDTINWNPPTIKAARITGRGSGANTSTPNWNAVGQSIANVGQSIAAGLNLRQQNIKYEKQQQLNLLKSRNELATAQYDKVAQLTTTNNNEFEISKNEFFHNKMDKYVKIKMAMDDPNSGIDLALAQQALSEINASVDKYSKQAPLVLAAAATLKQSLSKEFGTAGAIAGGVPTAQQQLLLDLIEGGDVSIADQNGDFIIYNKDDKGNVKDVFNIDQYMQVTNGGANPEDYFRTIIDTKDEQKDASEAIVGTAQSPSQTYYDYETVTSKDGESSITNLKWKTNDKGQPIGKEAAILNISKSGFNYMVDDPKEKQAMSDFWNDVIGVDADGITGQDAVWDPTDKSKKKYTVKGYVDADSGQFVFDPEGDSSQIYTDALGNELELTQQEFAKRWLAESAIHNNAPKPTIVSRTKKTDDTNKGYSYDMYEGYINNQKKIDAAIEADPNANLSSFNGQMMMATTTSAYRLRAGQTSKNEETGVITKIPPVWEHVVLTDATIGTKKVKTWVPVAGENVIPAQGAWSKMKAATKQYRTKN